MNAFRMKLTSLRQKYADLSALRVISSSLVALLFAIGLNLAQAGLGASQTPSFGSSAEKVLNKEVGTQAVLDKEYAKGMREFKHGEIADAIDIWRTIADLGHSEAQFNLGLIYLEGYGVDKNAFEAAKWWSKAALNGNAAERKTTAVTAMPRSRRRCRKKPSIVL